MTARQNINNANPSYNSKQPSPFTDAQLKVHGTCLVCNSMLCRCDQLVYIPRDEYFRGSRLAILLRAGRVGCANDASGQARLTNRSQGL